MELLIRKYRFNLSLFLFLVLHAIPFLKRDMLRLVLLLDYSVFLSLLLFLSIKGQHRGHPIKYAYLILLSILSLCLYFFGLSGSIAGFILSATVPYFLFMRIHTAEQAVDTFFKPTKWASICLIILGVWFFLNLIRRGELFNYVLMGYIFGISSINYVSLIFYGFTMMFVVFIEMKKAAYNSVPRWDFLLGLLLILCAIFFSEVYRTRSTFIASALLLIFYLRKYWKFMLAAGMVSFVLFFGLIKEGLETFMGAASIGSLATQSIRVSSAESLIKNAIAFNYDFTKTMSDSSIINLLFCLFPLSLFFIADFIYTIYNLFLFKYWSEKIKFGTLLAIAIFVPTYQMDFLSIFTLFIVMQYINFEQRRKLIIEDNALPLLEDDKGLQNK